MNFYQRLLPLKRILAMPIKDQKCIVFELHLLKVSDLNNPVLLKYFLELVLVPYL